MSQGSQCQDTILLYPFALASRGGIIPLVQYLETGSLQYLTGDNLRQTVLLGDKDRHQFAYKLSQDALHVAFKSASETCPIAKHGHGFRMLVYSSGS